jgi:steroid 5-alpha reductase family enzyme
MYKFLTHTSLSGLLGVLLAMTLLWLVSVRIKDVSIVDPFWGLGFVLITLVYYITGGLRTGRSYLAIVLITIWAVRLSYHLFIRNRQEGEDPRYRAMREHHGKRFLWISLFTVFLLQGILLWIISMPLLGSVISDLPLGYWDLMGSLIFFTGLTVESISDKQLARFRENPSNTGLVLDTGFWRYSRHPNYFGETILWWGIYLIAVGGEAYWTVVGPALLTFLLLRISGVTLLEKGLNKSRPDYHKYVETTSPFILWPPKNKDSRSSLASNREDY